MQRRRLTLVVLAGFGFNLALCQVSSAEQITFTGPQGRSITTQQNVNRDGNTINFNRSTTLPNGLTRSYSNNFTNNGDGNFTNSVTRNYGRDGNNYQATEQRSYNNGTYQNNYTFTGRNGKQTTINNTSTCSNGQCTRQEQYTYPDGKTRGVSETTSCHNGQCTRQEQYTYRNGQTRTVNFNSNRIGRRTWNATETITNRRGQERTFNYRRRL